MWSPLAVTLFVILSHLSPTIATVPLLAATGTRLLHHYTAEYADSPHPRAYTGNVTGSNRSDISDMRLAYTMLINRHCVTLDRMPSIVAMDCPAGQNHVTLHFDRLNHSTFATAQDQANVSVMQVNNAIEASERWTANVTLLTGSMHWGCVDSATGAPAAVMVRAVQFTVIDRHTLLVNTTTASVLSCMDDLKLSMNFTHVNSNGSHSIGSAVRAGQGNRHTFNVTAVDESAAPSPRSFKPQSVLDATFKPATNASLPSPHHHFRKAGTAPSFSFARLAGDNGPTLQSGQRIAVVQTGSNLDDSSDTVTYYLYETGAYIELDQWTYQWLDVCQADWAYWCHEQLTQRALSCFSRFWSTHRHVSAVCCCVCVVH